MVAVVLLSAPAFAQNSESTERAAARRLGYAGVEAYQAEKFALASEKLEKAYGVLHAPSLGLWSARALVKIGKLVEAADRYVEVTRLPLGDGDAQVQKKAQADAQAELATTQSSIPSVLIRLEGGEASSTVLTIDGARVSSQLAGEATPLDPGAHKIEGKSGEAHATSDVTLAPGEQKEVVLHFPVTKPAAANGAASAPTASAVGAVQASPSPDRAAANGGPRRTLGWAALGGGAFGLVVGGITGGLALSKRSQLDENPGCKDDHSCPKSLGADVSSLNTMRTISSVGFIAGGVLTATGIVLVLTSPSKGSTASSSLWFSPTAAGVAGKF